MYSQLLSMIYTITSNEKLVKSYVEELLKVGFEGDMGPILKEFGLLQKRNTHQ